MDNFYLTRIKEIIGECEDVRQSNESDYTKTQAMIQAYLDIREVLRTPNNETGITYVCQFVGVDGLINKGDSCVTYSRDYAIKYLNPSGYSYSEGQRAELQNQPTFEGYVGPMWDGIREGKVAVLRYETWKTYELLSR